MSSYFIGTSGYSYPSWKGAFYPQKLSPKKMLGYYGERLNSVEINNTFYHLPRREVLEQWASQVPAGFRFSIKASRRISHQRRINEGSQEPLAYLVQNLEALGDRLGTMLVQLPPSMQLNLERLQTFLGYLPEGLPTAFEFRHPSWYDDSVYAVLSARNVALVINDSGDPEADAPLIRTADWGYLRLRRSSYDSAALESWAGQLLAQDWQRAFVFFKHEDEGVAPKLAKELQGLLEGHAEASPGGGA